MTRSNDNISIPQTIGCAVDMMFCKENPVAYIIDCLTIYETIFIPADPEAVRAIYSNCDPGELDPLFNTQRIKYVPARSRDAIWDRNKDPIDNITKHLQPFNSDDLTFSDFLSHLNNHLFHPSNPDYASWTSLLNEALNVFDETSKRRGYEWLMPTDLRGSINQNRRVGLINGIARINDLIVSGVHSLDLDEELATYLEICFPKSEFSEVLCDTDATVIKPDELVKNLSRIKNVPPLGDMLRRQQITTSEAVGMITSDEAFKLRQWLFNNIAPGVDLRDAYDTQLKKLPSKSEWTGWVRFGLVSGVSTLVGALLADPIAGTAIGLAIGAADQKYGGKATELVGDSYHPRDWFSYIQKIADYNQVRCSQT